MLVLDEEELDKALSKDPDGVAKLFAANYDGSTDTSDFSYLAKIDGKTKAGTYAVSVTTGADGKITSATIGGVACGIDGTRITALTGDAAGMVLQLDNQTPSSTFTGEVHLKLGKTGELGEKLAELTNSTNGPLAILEENYGEIMDSIDDKIAREERRLTNLKSRLKDQYSRLDALLNTLTNTQSQLTSAIDKLDS